MSERATVTQSVQLGVETSEGVAAPANLRLRSINVTPAIALETARHEALGEKLNALVTTTKESSTVSVEGTPTYDELTYQLAAVIGNMETVEISTGVYEHTFTLRNRTTDTVPTFTVERGDVTRAFRATGVRLTEIGLNFRRSDGTAEVTGSGVGRRITDGVSLTGNTVVVLSVSGGVPASGTFTLEVDGDVTSVLQFDATATEVENAVAALVGSGNVICTGGPLDADSIRVEFVGDLAQTDVPVTPTDTFDVGSLDAAITAGAEAATLPLIPVLASDVSVYVDDVAETHGTTKLHRVLATDFTLSDRAAEVWVLDAEQESFVTTVETKPSGTQNLLVAADDTGMGIALSFRKGQVLNVRTEAVGPSIDGVSNYTLTVDTTGQVESVPEHSDEDGVFATGAGLAVQNLTVRLVNTLPAL